MTGFMGSDGSALAGALKAGICAALNEDANGNLLVSMAGASNSAALATTGSVTNDNDTVQIAVADMDTALVQVLGTFTLTVLFEASPDAGTTWYSVSGVQATGTIASSTTTTGYWRVNVAGFTHFRVRSHPITSGTANITIKLTAANMSTTVLNAQALGQQTMANSSSVVIASDQVVPVKGATVEVAGQGTGVVNGANTDLIPSTDVSAYKWLSLQIQGTYVATLSFQCSNDNVNFVACKLMLTTSFVDNNSASSTSGTGQIWTGPVQFRYFRVRATAWTSNASLAGTLELFAEACTLPITNPAAFVVPQSSGGTSDFHLVSANSNNATSIKASGGQVYGYEISNTNAAFRYVKLYNKASAPAPASDPPFRTIGVPPTSRVSFHSTTGLAMGTGIALAAVTGIADNDNTSVGASDLVIDLDYK